MKFVDILLLIVSILLIAVVVLQKSDDDASSEFTGEKSELFANKKERGKRQREACAFQFLLYWAVSGLMFLLRQDQSQRLFLIVVTFFVCKYTASFSNQQIFAV